jgi:DNA repair exonuclease SbcCD ATPase subunit
MGNLSEFASQLMTWRAGLWRTEARLCQVQEKFETFFAEIERAREGELGQLREHLLAQRGGLPGDLDAELDAAWEDAEAELDAELATLRERHQALVAKAEEARTRSMNRERSVHQKNADLDAQEEALKLRNAELLHRIDDFQRRIRVLGYGFGFFKNLFALRPLQRERAELKEEQEDVRARIESLREAWNKADQDWAAEEEALQANWIDHTTQAQAVQAKIDHIAQVRLRLLERSALERVLFGREPKLPTGPSEGGVACARCQTDNHPEQHFCAICGQRLTEDRPDLLGSLAEVAELNRHHRRFAAGVKACQEIIGLVRGLVSGLTNFRESVDSMIDSQQRYPISELVIDVPQEAIQFGAHFDRLEAAAKVEESLHPVAFAAQIEAVMENVYSEENIRGFFETMGEELSRQADSQW